MKKMMTIFVALLMAGCSEYFVEGPTIPSNPNDPTNPGTVVTEDFPWNGCDPQDPVSLGRTAVYGNVYDNHFKMWLGGSQCDPNPLALGTFAIPHVGPNGIVIYNNVANDATYTITGISADGWVYYTIRSESGHTLKYNIAKNKNGTWIWFLKKGLPYDDGVNNIITVIL